MPNPRFIAAVSGASILSILALVLLIPGAAIASVTGGGSGAVLDPRAAGSSSIKVAIAKTGASSASGYVGLTLYAATGGESCDAYSLCEDPNTANFTCATGQILSTVSMTAADLAAAIVSAINTNCPAGITAVAEASTITITSGVVAVNACVFSDEMGTSDGFALGLNVGDLPSGTCGARNVCDGVSTNERSTDPPHAGFSFVEAPVDVPALGSSGTVVLALLLGFAPVVRALRRIVHLRRS
jgi:hypothetical protein